MNTSVLVGIGQRYHVIVEAKPNSTENPLPQDGNYWISTWRAECFRFPSASKDYERSGILRYGSSDALPTTKPWKGNALNCSDETYTSLKPVVPWNVPQVPANDPLGRVGENLTVQRQPGQGKIFPLASFSMGGDDFAPLQIEYGNPTFLKLKYTGEWNPLWVVFPENYTNTDWVSLPRLRRRSMWQECCTYFLVGSTAPQADNGSGVYGPQRLERDDYRCTPGKH